MAKSKTSALVVQGQDGGQVNAQLTISNTDIVTMMVVKNRKLLQERQLVIDSEIEAEVAKEVEVFKAAVQKELDKGELDELVEAYRAFLCVANKDKTLQITLCSPSNNREYIRNLYYNEAQYNSASYSYGGMECKVVNRKRINTTFFFLGTEVRNKSGKPPQYVAAAYGLPCNIKMSVPFNTTLSDLIKEKYKIENLLRNEKTLKEQVIANLTEKALLSSPLLKQLTVDVGLLD